MDESRGRHSREDSRKNVGNVRLVIILGKPPTRSANRYTSRFLLVSLSVDAILHESTIYGRQEKLSKMTDGSELGDVYGVTIERIKAQAGDKIKTRPLQADELCHA